MHEHPHSWQSARRRRCQTKTIELDDLSDVDEDSDVGSDPISRANTPTVDEDTNPQTFLFNELKNFTEGQANRIALHVGNGANVDYYEDSRGRTPLHVLFDAFSASDVDDETKKRSCVECKTNDLYSVLALIGQRKAIEEP